MEYEIIEESKLSDYLNELNIDENELSWKTKSFKLNNEEDMKDIDLKNYNIPMYKFQSKTKYIKKT